MEITEEKKKGTTIKTHLKNIYLKEKKQKRIIFLY
jgi:hypothetical protein